MIQLTTALQLPTRTLLGQRVPKKTLLEATGFSPADRKKIVGDIAEIEIVAKVCPDTMNIPAFSDDETEFQEILFLNVRLKRNCTFTRLGELLHRAIPYPTVLIFRHEEQYALHLAQKRFQKIARDKVTLDKVFCTRWLQDPLSEVEALFVKSLEVRTFNYQNLRLFYRSFLDRVVALELAYDSGRFLLPTSDGFERIVLLEKIKELKNEMGKIQKLRKATTQFNLQVEYALQLQKLVDAHKRLLDSSTETKLS